MMVRPATSDDFAQFYANISDAYVIDGDGELLAFGGLVRRGDGRLWAWIDTRPGVRPVQLVKAVRQALKRSKEPVFVPCESQRFPTAERLLHVLGFEPTGETHNDMRVWVCQV